MSSTKGSSLTAVMMVWNFPPPSTDTTWMVINTRIEATAKSLMAMALMGTR